MNAGVFALIIGLLCALVYGSYGWAIGKRIGMLMFALLGGLVFGLAAGAFAGEAGIQHLSLRVVLRCKNYIPWDYACFLDYASERIFLQKVGGGYIFIHRMLQEHFAQMKLNEK